MSRPNSGGRGSTRLFNWLERLDQVAQTLPRALGWIEPYGPFMLIRYPHLRPQRPSSDLRSQHEFEVDEATITQTLQEWESRIADHTETAVCLDALNPEQRKQLSALLIETIAEIEDHQVLWKKGVDMDPDLNKYDLEHVVTDHPRMSRAEWQAIDRKSVV